MVIVHSYVKLPEGNKKTVANTTVTIESLTMKITTNKSIDTTIVMTITHHWTGHWNTHLQVTRISWESKAVTVFGVGDFPKHGDHMEYIGGWINSYKYQF